MPNFPHTPYNDPKTPVPGPSDNVEPLNKRAATGLQRTNLVLHKRNLNHQELVGLGIEIKSQREAEDELGARLNGAVDFCERLPYHGVDGHDLGFARHRINYLPGGDTYKEKGKDGNVKVLQYAKYMSPKGVNRQYAYLPKIAGMDWDNILFNPKEELVITEGEYKAITACKAGMPCVGLGGVWMFGHKSGVMPTPLDQTTWLGKTVFICYDADEESNWDVPLKSQVGQAALQLATRLLLLGAVPELLYIARTEAFKRARMESPKAKMGLDDFILAGGDVNELLATRTKPIGCSDLANLNSKYACCKGWAGKGVMDVAIGKMYSYTDFKNTEGNLIRAVVGPKGGITKVYIAEEFLEQRDRPTIERVIFEPSQSPGYDREQAVYNQWTGWPEIKLEGEVGDEIQARVVATWRTLIGKLFGEHADYFQSWVAHLVQRPGEKTSIGVILVSVLNGVGKSLLGEVVRGLVGDVHGKSAPLERLKSNFNSVLEQCLFLQLDEANGVHEGLEPKLNDLITADKVQIEHKGLDAVTVSNYMRVYMTSNSTRPIRLNAENRRWLVVTAGVVASELAEWSEWCGTAAKLLKSAEGLWTLREWLSGVSLEGWNPTARVVITEDMEDMVESSQTWHNGFVTGVLERCRDAFAQGELWMTTPSVVQSKGGKPWADFKAAVKAAGGRVLRRTYWGEKDGGGDAEGQGQGDGEGDGEPKGTVVAYVLDMDSSLPTRRARKGKDKNGKERWRLELDPTGKLRRVMDGSEYVKSIDWAGAALRMTRAWNEVESSVGSTGRSPKF